MTFARKLNELSPGKSAVEPGLKDAITARNHLFLPFIESTSVENGTAMYLSNMPEVCRLICREARIDAEQIDLIRGSCDGGGDSVKISFSFIDVKAVGKARNNHEQLATGVRKVFIFVLTTGVNESYTIMKHLLKLIDLQSLKQQFPNAVLTWAQDTKMNWIFAGKSHGGRSACIACLRQHTDKFNSALPLRTVAETESDVQKYLKLIDGRLASFARTHLSARS